MTNNGEAAALYSLIFLLLFVLGGGCCSLDAVLGRNKKD